MPEQKFKICPSCSKKNNASFASCWACKTSLVDISVSVVETTHADSLVDGLHFSVESLRSGFQSGESYAKKGIKIVNELWSKLKSSLNESNSKNTVPSENMMLDDAFKMLDVSKGATLEEVKKAYKRKIAEWHPDKLGAMAKELQEIATKQVQKINQAYGLLKSNLECNSSTNDCLSTDIKDACRNKVVPVMTGMISETERVYLNHVKECGAEVTSLGLIKARLFAGNFASHALSLVAWNDAFELCSEVIYLMISLSKAGVNSAELKDAFFEDFIKSHNAALYEEASILARGDTKKFNEKLADIYLDALKESVTDIDLIDSNFTRNLSFIVGGVVNIALDQWSRLIVDLNVIKKQGAIHKTKGAAQE